jgi:Protein of unknown function (DUF3551)
MRFALIGLAALTGTLAISVQPGNAQYWQGRGTWCIQPPSGTWDCSYYSQQQCLASVSGRRGTCSQSPQAYWDAREGKQGKRSKTSQRQDWRW